MTVRDLLRHTSGLPGNVAVDTLYREAGLPPLSECDLREIVAHLNRVQLLFHPGTQSLPAPRIGIAAAGAMYALHFVSSFVVTHHVAQRSVHLHNFLLT